MKQYTVTVGNDPELFIKRGIYLVPAEFLAEKRTFPRFLKVDNAAVEIHPGPHTCLQQQNADIAAQISSLKKLLGEDYNISLRTCERIRPRDLSKYKSLTSFGCSPSLVFHPNHGVMPSVPEANPLIVRERSIGYHVHLGTRTPLAVKRDIAAMERVINVNPERLKALKNHDLKLAELLHTTEGRVRLVQACDLLVGLPAVLIDRDSRQVWRRKLLGYGKAGEFREQKHGFEYRTLGPWALKHPMFAWWANAMVRDALIATMNDLDIELKKHVSMLEVAKAINTNNLYDAVPLWNKVKKIIGTEFDSLAVGSHPCHSSNIKKFEFIVANGGIKFVLGKNNSLDVWEARRPNESGRRVWGAFYLGFPDANEELLKDQKINENYNDFKKTWSPNKDNISEHIL